MLTYLTIAEAGRRFREGSLQPAVLLEALLERIGALDDRVGAWVDVWADVARHDAQRAARELAAGGDRGPLHGIPIGVKDLIDVRGSPTLTGTPEFWEGQPAAEDAALIQRLRDAGAILLGKTHTHPFAMGTITPATRNPWDLDRVAGGSSGGSAAAVAAGMCAGALGSDTGGSIRLPAALCGVTGLKPTYGRVSRRGVFPLAWTLDHLGPLARTVEDCALLLQVMAGHDPADPRSSPAPVPDFLAGRGAGVQSLRIARLVGPFVEELHPDYPPALDQAVRTLERLGAKVYDADLPFAEEVPLLMDAILPAEAATIHHDRLASDRERFHPSVGPRLEAGALIPATVYLQAQRLRATMADAVLALFAHFDLLLTPTDRQPAPRVSEARGATTRYTAPFNLAGLPALALPCGFTANRLPLSLQLIGAPLAEATVIRAGIAYQQATDWHEQRPSMDTERRRPG